MASGGLGQESETLSFLIMFSPLEVWRAFKLGLKQHNLFKIDQSAYVYIGFDERWIPRRTESKIQKNDLVTDSLKPENPWFYTLPIPQRTTGYTNPTTLILQGNVTLDGISQGGGDGMYRVIFVEADKLAVSSPLGKLAARWGEIKSFK